MRWIQGTLGIAYAAIVCVGGGITWAENATFYRYLTRGVLNLIAAVSAPQGSLLTALDPDACDLTNLGDDDGEKGRPVGIARRHPERITPSSRAERGIPSPAGPEPYYRFRDPSAFGLGMTA